ncbi:MAG: sugar phosphate isomerase/epimerase, partial [Planctomycetes bacterium]|nr:sugar phosphate isomerase/epimerase [Planctomycetota bacterium]
MMTMPIGIQLYSVRDNLTADFEGTIKAIAEMGYAGVEPAGNYGAGVESAKKLFDSLGLEVPSAHLPMPVGDDMNKAFDMAETLCTKRIISG